MLGLSRRGKRRLVVFLTLTLIAATGAVTFRVIRSIQQDRLIAQAKQHGMTAYAKGDLKTTLNQLSYFFEHEKEDLDVNLTFADARARIPLPQGQHLAEAVDLYSTHGLKLLERKREFPNARERRLQILSRLLDLYGQLGLRVEVSHAADELLSVAPDSIQALGAKAEVLVLERHFDDAQQTVSRLIELDPNNLSWRRLALDIQIGQGVSQDALVEQCREWAHEYNGDGRFHLLTASILVELDEADQAREELRAVCRLGASTFPVLDRAVSLLDLLEMRAEAGELVQQTKTRFPAESWVREVAVRRLWHDNRLNEAREELALADRELPALSTALRRLGVLTLVAQRQMEEARAELQRLMDAANREVSDGDRAWASALATALDSSNSKWRDRIEALGYALALLPEDPVLHFIMGEACMAIGENSQAILAFRNAYDLDPDWMLAGVAYSDALLTAGRVIDSYNVSRTVVTRSPRDQYAPLLVFARSYIALRKAGEDHLAGAEDDLINDLAVALQGIYEPQQPDLRVLEALVETMIASGERDRAATLVRDATPRLNDSEDLIRLLELSSLNDLGVEDELLQKARDAGGDAASIALAESQWQARAGHIDRAVEVIDQATRGGSSHTHSTQLRCAKVQLMLQRGDAGAIGEARRLIADYPADVDVQRLMLAQSAIWNDVQLVAQAMANLKAILGERSPQVRLAEANFLLHHHARSDAMLARAIALINGVLQQTPDSLAALSLRAEVMMIGPKPNVFAAVESLERAASLYPGESNLLVRLISLLQRQGEFEAAGRHLASLAELSHGDPRLRSVELRLLASQDDFELALVRAASLVSEDSPLPDQLVLASIHEQAGQRDQARAIYENLLAQHPADELIVSQAAAFFANIGDFDRGLALMKSIDRQREPAAQALAIGGFYQRYGRNEAAEWLAKAVHDNPNSIEARYALAKHCLQRQNRAAAREHALAGLAIAPDDSRLRAIVAVATLNASPSERAEAIKALKKISAGDQDLLATLEVLELAPHDQSVPSQRYLAEAQQLVKEHGNFLPAWLLTITLHVQAGYPAEAISLSRQAVSRFPAEAEPAQWSTELLVKAGRYREALVDAREWRRRTKAGSLEVDAAIADILIELGRPGEAVTQLEADAALLRAQCDQFPERFTVWLRALAHSGEPERAMELVQPLLDQLKWRDAWRAIAIELEPGEAQAALLEIDARAQTPGERIGLAAIWAELGRRTNDPQCFDRAHANAVDAAKQPELRAQALIAQGGIAEARNDWQSAEALYRQAIEHAPDDPVARNNLANVLARTPQRCDEALEHIRRALGLSPGNPDFLDTYAMVLVGLNRVEEAESALSQALASRPSDIAIKLNFIEVLLRQEKIDQARDELFALQQRIQGVLHADPAQQKRLNDLLERVQSHDAVIGA